MKAVIDIDTTKVLGKKLVKDSAHHQSTYSHLKAMRLKPAVEPVAVHVKKMAEKMITIAKDDSLHSKRKVLAYVTKEDVVKKLFDEIAPKYKEVNGGYCRIIKTGPRRGDAAEMCIIELV